MSELQAQPYSPAPTQVSKKRSSPVVLWLAVLLLALVAFAAALWWAGGVSALTGLWAPISGFLTPGPSGPNASVQAVVPAHSPASSAATPTATLPPDALREMFAQQLRSHTALTDLVNDRMESMALGKPAVGDTWARMPIKVTYRDGTSTSAILGLTHLQGIWYFAGLVHPNTTDQAVRDAAAEFDQGVVQTITAQQGEAGTQEMLTEGVLGRGYTRVGVDSVVMGPRTATVDVTMSGGSEAPSQGRFVCISKTDNSTTRWFVARFEKR